MHKRKSKKKEQYWYRYDFKLLIYEYIFWLGNLKESEIEIHLDSNQPGLEPLSTFLIAILVQQC